jgi:uncharacterized membrane protein
MEKLKSRKFWVAIVGALVPVISEAFGLDLDPEAIMSIAGIVIGYVLGQGYVDGQAANGTGS